MAQHDLDLFVIGGGSGGVRAARIAAQHGARVAIAESDRWGGTCVIRGCVPKKLMVYASSYARDFSEAAAFGWSVPRPSFDWSVLKANVDREVERLSRLYAHNMASRGVNVVRGRAVLDEPHVVRVGEDRYRAANILVATGGRPWVPKLAGSEHTIVSDDVFELEELPRRVAVVGGGYIGVEFAHIFRGLGAEVTAIHRGAMVLRGFDADIRRHVTANLARAGIDDRLETTVDAISRGPDGLSLRLSSGDDIEVDQVLCAIGRRPNTADLGLEAAGVELAPNGAVVVDEHSRSSVPHIFAVGDCTDRLNLTPVAIRDGHAVADNLFGDADRRIDHRCVPTAVFSQPPAATVGLTEREAREHAIDVEVLGTEFRPLRHTVGGADETVMIKLVLDRESDRVLGAHMVGLDAPEIIQSLAVAIKMGATRADLRRTTALHPTTAEELVLI